MRSALRFAVAASLVAGVAVSVPAASAADNDSPQAKFIKDLHWRQIGPFRGGRADAVTGLPADRGTYYFGASGGGVWKTTDAGRSWKNVSDGSFGGSIGDVAVSEWDPNVVYAGTGEVTVRGNVSEGDGMWKSTDAGKTWKHAGLEDSRHIVRIRIHPRNPDLVYAAVLGHLFGASAERGVYRSKDGGKTWERVLHVDDDTGAVDLALDPVNPRILYAGMWRVKRTPWSFSSGGPGSGLWKSVDGGDTWTDLSHSKGMPAAPLGNVGVSIARTNPDTVYALIEAPEGGLFRSKDGGKTWERRNSGHAIRQRAWIGRVVADPTDAESVYMLNVSFQHSKDGGKTFAPIRTPHGDNHDLWIAPDDGRRMIECNDGGSNVSEDGGQTWSSQGNQPTAQIYRVNTDNAYPYHILGAQQDNSALRILHRSFNPGGIGPTDWEPTAGGESGYILADPRNPDVVYGGSYEGLLMWVNHRTHEMRDVSPWPEDGIGEPAENLKYRFQWNYPLLFSRDGSSLYAGSNVLMRSRNDGQDWQVISPDLTRNDKSKQGSSGGPITKDNTSIEYYDTIFTLAESPQDAKIVWVGSDDGLVHVTRDGGATWKNVSPRGLPEWAQINSIEANPSTPGGAYLAATRYKLDDERPILFKTTDFGASWTRIDHGIPSTAFTRVVRADPEQRGLLYAGTQHGVFVSFDDGDHWQTLQANLPLVPVTDLTIKDGDLIAATEGRAFWSLDDLTPVRNVAAHAALLDEPLHVFLPRVAYLQAGDFGNFAPGPKGENPPNGLVVRYTLHEAAGKRPLKVEILTSAGKVLKTERLKPAKGEDEKPPGAEAAKGAAPAAAKPEASKAPAAGAAVAAPATPPAPAVVEEEEEEGPDALAAEFGFSADEEPALTGKAGLNQYAWNLETKAAKAFPGMVLWSGRPEGPTVAPGHYQARLTVGEQSVTVPFELRNDPRSKSNEHDLSEQAAFVAGVRDTVNRADDEIRRIRDVRGQLETLRKRLRAAEPQAEPGTPAKPESAVGVAAKDLAAKLTTIEEALYQTHNHAAEDALNYATKLTDKLNGLGSRAALGDRPPTAADLAVRDDLTAKVNAQLEKLATIWEKDVPAFNDTAKAVGGGVIVPAPRLQ